MTAYNHRVNHRHRVRRLRNTNRALYTLLFIVVVSITGLSVYFWQQSQKQPPVVELKPRAAGVYYGAVKKQYENELFSFNSTKDWQISIENSSVPSRYVYYSQNNGLAEYELVVYISSIPERIPVSYIVPVTVKNGKPLAEVASPKCGVVNKNNPQAIYKTEYQKVAYYCNPMNSKQEYAAGVVGGSYGIPMYDSKGQLKQVSFTFVNHKAADQEQVLIDIINSFKLQ